jgi:hypothetical protein
LYLWEVFRDHPGMINRGKPHNAMTRMNRIIRPLRITSIVFLLCALPSGATPVTVEDLGVSPNEVVSISTSGSGAESVYAGVVNLRVNGELKPGFCIDPFHESLSGPQSYTLEPLSAGPKLPGGPMGDDAAMEIAQLWQQYFSPTMGAADAAGLQIAIWEVVGAGFTLNQANDYGASTMRDWWSRNRSTAPAADLQALTGSGQDYVIDSVPDGGTTAMLLGGALWGLLWVRRKLCDGEVGGAGSGGGEEEDHRPKSGLLCSRDGVVGEQQVGGGQQ